MYSTDRERVGYSPCDDDDGGGAEGSCLVVLLFYRRATGETPAVYFFLFPSTIFCPHNASTRSLQYAYFF